MFSWVHLITISYIDSERYRRMPCTMHLATCPKSMDPLTHTWCPCTITPSGPAFTWLCNTVWRPGVSVPMSCLWWLPLPLTLCTAHSTTPWQSHHALLLQEILVEPQVHQHPSHTLHCKSIPFESSSVACGYVKLVICIITSPTGSGY